MKKLMLLLLAPLVFSCAQYETVTLVDATPVYESRKMDGKPLVIVPANTKVLMAGRGEQKKVKHNGKTGYAVSPSYASYSVVQKTEPRP